MTSTTARTERAHTTAIEARTKGHEPHTPMQQVAAGIPVDRGDRR